MHFLASAIPLCHMLNVCFSGPTGDAIIPTLTPLSMWLTAVIERGLPFQNRNLLAC